MSDVLLELGRRPGARKLISSLGLPIPMPVELDRARSPRTERPLAAKPAAVSLGGGAVGAAIAATLAQAGATSWVHGDAAAAREAGEAWGTPPKTLDLDAVGDARFHGLVFDASTLAAPSDLERLYAFYHALVRKIASALNRNHTLLSKYTARRPILSPIQPPIVGVITMPSEYAVHSSVRTAWIGKSGRRVGSCCAACTM